MQKWELKRLYIPVKVSIRKTDEGNLFWENEWQDETKKAFVQADALAAEGWELVGIAPEIGGHEQWYRGSVGPYGAGSSYTSGYLFMFKRPKS